MGWRLENNQASDNDEHGIVVQGPDMMDAGGNRGEGNRGLSGSRPAVQCEINRAACTQN
jgi:parallel beta-helix repeat protein